MRRLALAMAAVLALTPAAAQAHRGHSSLSIVEIDSRTGAVTVEHRLQAHDIEPLLVRIAPDAQPSLDDPAALGALRTYAATAFRLAGPTGAPVPLTFASEELAGDDIRLCYRAQLPAGVTSVRVDSNIAEEAHDDQENQVNVRMGSVTRTVVFRRGSAPETVTFEE